MTLPASYTTVEKVLTTYPPMGSVTNITSAQIANIIGEQQAVIDAKLAHLYAVPFSPVPPVIEAIVDDLVAYRLLTTRVRERSRTGEFPEHFRYAQLMLEALAAGSVTVLTSSGTMWARSSDQDSVRGEVWSDTMTYDPTMNEGRWEKMVIDTDKPDQ